MPIASLNTLQYAKALEAADVPTKQAKVYANLLNEALSVNLEKLATKDDLENLHRVETKIEKLDAKFDMWMQLSLGLLAALVVMVLRNSFVKP